MKPKNPRKLKGIYGARRRLKQSISRLRSQVVAMEEMLEENEPKMLLQNARAALGDCSHILTEVSQWETLLYVANETYMDPLAELEKEDHETT